MSRPQRRVARVRVCCVAIATWMLCGAPCVSRSPVISILRSLSTIPSPRHVHLTRGDRVQNRGAVLAQQESESAKELTISSRCRSRSTRYRVIVITARIEQDIGALHGIALTKGFTLSLIAPRSFVRSSFAHKRDNPAKCFPPHFRTLPTISSTLCFVTALLGARASALFKRGRGREGEISKFCIPTWKFDKSECQRLPMPAYHPKLCVILAI